MYEENVSHMYDYRTCILRGAYACMWFVLSPPSVSGP